MSVGRGAFYQCTNIVSVELPTTVTMIGGSAFEDCGLKSIDLTNIDHLGESVFSNCNYLTSVTFGNKLTDIPLMCFQSCPIQTLTLQEGLQTIGHGAFWVPLDMNPELYPDFATRFTEVTIPSTVTSIGISSDRNTAFYSIPKVQKIYVKKSSESLAGAPWGAESVEWIG